MTIKIDKYEKIINDFKFKNELVINSEIPTEYIIKEIMENFGMNKITVKNHLDNLELFGFIKRSNKICKLLR